VVACLGRVICFVSLPTDMTDYIIHSLTLRIFLAAIARRGRTLRKPKRRASIVRFICRGGRLPRLHRRDPIEVSCRAVATRIDTKPLATRHSPFWVPAVNNHGGIGPKRNACPLLVPLVCLLLADRIGRAHRRMQQRIGRAESRPIRQIESSRMLKIINKTFHSFLCACNRSPPRYKDHN